tara:strand:+ start:2577 stop:2921 length:345 start_codon:yes stop_codon:yes gene_type:complete
MTKSSEIGDFLINLVVISQTLITVSYLSASFYRFFVNEGEAKWLLSFYRQVKPIQMLLGGLFLLWWVGRSNSWKSKTLAVNNKIRMAIFQYSIITIYIAFELMIKHWRNPDIDL